MSITFNKVICKMVLKNHGIKTAQYHLIKKNHPYNREAIIKQLGLPLFVKPNKGGSSFGASKVETIEDFHPAIEKCFAVDDEALVEEFLKGREITCGVLKLKNKVQSVGITEIVSNASFFDFDQKYSENGAQEITPAPISPEKYDECLKLSAFIYQDLACLGIARIDYILVKDQLYFVEVNTIPGLTSRSLIPQQAQHSGINLSEVFDQMIQDAME